jgi:hypothetical protein
VGGLLWLLLGAAPPPPLSECGGQPPHFLLNHPVETYSHDASQSADGDDRPGLPVDPSLRGWGPGGLEVVRGDVVLQLEIPDELFATFEWVLDTGYREAMIPAAALNEHRSNMRRLSEDEIETLTNARWDSFHAQS